VLPSAPHSSTIATGFLVAAPWDHVGHTAPSPSVRARAREDELEEILGTVGQTFLGLTINCARCHDHKFDPVTAIDYYRLKAVFEGVQHGDRVLPITSAEIAKRADYGAKFDALRQRIGDIEQKGRDRLGNRGGKNVVRPIAQWNFADDARDQVGTLHGKLVGKAHIADGRLVLDGKTASLETEPLDRDLHEKTLEAWVNLSDLDQRGGGVLTVSSADGNVFDSIVFGERQPREWILGSDFFRRTKDLKGPVEKANPTDSVHLAVVCHLDGRVEFFRNGQQYGKEYTSTLEVFKAKNSRVLIGVRHAGGGNAHFRGSVDEARLYDRALSADEVRRSFEAGPGHASFREVIGSLTPDERDRLALLEKDLARLRAERPEPGPAILTYAAVAKQPAPTFLLKRGDPDSPAEQVYAASPTAIEGPASVTLKFDTQEGERRLKLANWITDKDNPLTWRVLANRIWQHHFGEGIVRTPNDFGFNGDRPSHPELLDSLASQLRDNGGRMKPLHRAIMLSATYRQASAPGKNATDVDADNRLLSYYSPRRLEAEAVRDGMLAVSGLLNPQAGGPSFRPFRIETFNSTFYKLVDFDAPEFQRRSVYRMAINSARDPLLDVLDCPDSSVKTPRRAVTTTPLQALAMMNNSFVQRQVGAFANRLKREAGAEVERQIELGYRYALGREPTNEEAAAARGVAEQHGLNAVCWALMNSSEFVTVR